MKPIECPWGWGFLFSACRNCPAKTHPMWRSDCKRLYEHTKSMVDRYRVKEEESLKNALEKL